MYAIKYWSVRHARPLNRIYKLFEQLLINTGGMWQLLGFQRFERPVAAVERNVKGLLFDCQMCGQCILGSTGLSCPMNCPKSIRNGPCGGVRPNEMCEVKPDMRCVWVEAWCGSQKTGEVASIQVLQPPVDARLQGRSSWMAVVQNHAPQQTAGPEQ